MGLDAGRQYIKRFHGFVVAKHIILHHFHRFQLFQTGFFGNFIFPFVGIIFEVTHIGNVTDVAHLISQMQQIAE